MNIQWGCLSPECDFRGGSLGPDTCAVVGQAEERWQGGRRRHVSFINAKGGVSERREP